MIWFHRASDSSQWIQTVAIASTIDVTFDDLYQSYTSCVHEHNALYIEY